MKRKEWKRYAILLAAGLCWLWWENYHQLVWLTECERMNGSVSDIVVIDGGLEESGTAIFTEKGPLLKPWLLGLAFAANYENIPRVRRGRWGGEFRMLSGELKYGEEPAKWQDLGKINDACWRTLTEYLRDTLGARGGEIVDERGSA